MAMYWCYVWGSMFYLTWLPTYLMKGRGLNEREVGLYAASPFVLGMLGNLLGGHLSDLSARRLGVGPGRRVVGAASLTIAALLILVSALTQGKAASIALLSLGFGAMDCMLPSAWAICLDLGREHSGAVAGAMNSAGQAGGLACSVVFGYLAGASGSYDAPLFVIAAMVLVSAWLFSRIDPTRPLIPDEPGRLIAGEPTCALGISSHTFAWGIGVPGYPPPPTPMTAEGLLERAEALRVGVVQFAENLPLNGLADADLVALCRSAERRQIDVELGTSGIDPVNLDSHVRLARFFKSPIVRVVLDTADRRPTPDEVVAALRCVMPAFERAGVCLAIENHDRFPSATLAEILDRLDSPCAGICLDTANSLGCLETVETVLEVLGPRIVNLHIKDFDIFRPRHQKGFIIEGRPAGRGRLDIPGLLARLRTLGRDPNAILELWQSPGADIAAVAAEEAIWAAESVSYLRRLIPD